MKWEDEVRRRVRRAGVSAAGEASIVEELSQHVEDRYQELVGRGTAKDDARRLALEELDAAGGLDAGLLDAAVRNRASAMPQAKRGGSWWSGLVVDARYAVRVLLREPTFTVVAVLTLGVGVGVTTAMFSLVHALLLRPLPYPEPDRLATVVSPGMLTPANLDDWRSSASTIERWSGWSLDVGVMVEERGARRVSITLADDEYLTLLGARPLQGRLWDETESRAGGEPVALVSERLWLDVLGGSDVTGRAITVDGVSHAVIGVLPAAFHNLGYSVDLWLPLAHRPARPRLSGIVRLRAGVTIEQTQAELSALAERMEQGALAVDYGRSVRVHSLRDVLTADDVRTPLLVLFGTAVFVLLLACANLANLLLARSAGRGRELAIRHALGAGRGAMLRQLAVEHGVLGLAGAAAGLLLGWWFLRAVVLLLPSYFGRLPLETAGISGLVLATMLAAALTTMLLAGVAPVFVGLRAASASVRSTQTRSTRLWREALIAAEVALALVLLIGTALLVRTYVTLRPASPGFETRDRVVASLTLHDDVARNREVMRRILREVEQAVPGVRAAAATHMPLSGMVAAFRIIAVDGEPLPAAERPPLLDVNAVTPGLMDVLGMRMAVGRPLNEGDDAARQPALVLNRSAARRFWPSDETPIGHRLTLALPDGDTELVVVGVMEDVRTSGMSTTSRSQALVSYWQLPLSYADLVVHAPRASQIDESTVRRLVASIDGEVPVGVVRTLASIVAASIAHLRYQTALMTGFAVLALVLAIIGCYGVLTYSVSQRTREFGVRMALGAGRRSIVGVVLLRGFLLVAAGLVLGAVLAAATSRVLERSLYGVVTPNDPPTFALAALVLLAVSLFAAYLPARRAAAVDPLIALRDE